MKIYSRLLISSDIQENVIPTRIMVTTVPYLGVMCPAHAFLQFNFLLFTLAFLPCLVPSCCQKQVTPVPYLGVMCPAHVFLQPPMSGWQTDK